MADIPGHVRLSARSEQTLQLAELAAQANGLEYVGTEHVLFGVLSDDQARDALAREGVDVGAVARRLFEAGVKKPSPGGAALPQRPLATASANQPNRLPLALRVVAVVEIAHETSRLDGREFVEPTDLIAGIMKEGRGLGADLLRACYRDPLHKSPRSLPSP